MKNTVLDDGETILPSFHVVEKMDRKHHLQNFKETFSYLAKEGDILIIFVNLTIWSLSTFSAIWLFQKQWQDDAIDIKFFGYIWASYTLTSALFSRLVSPIRKKIGNKADNGSF